MNRKTLAGIVFSILDVIRCRNSKSSKAYALDMLITGSMVVVAVILIVTSLSWMKVLSIIRGPRG